MRDKTLSGQAAAAPRWKRGDASRSRGGDCGADPATCFGTLNWAVGQLYAARYFPPEAKAKIEALVANLKAAFRAGIEQLDWMGPATKAEALKKLDTYTIKVGYPDTPRATIPASSIRHDDLLGNVRRAAAADWAFYVAPQRRAGRPRRLADDAADQRRLQRLAARHRLPGRHPAAADLRRRRRPGRSTTARSAASSATS